MISSPTSIRFSGLTRNSASFRFGSTLATAKWPRIACVVFFGLARAGAELDGRIAVAVGGALRHHLDVVHLEDGHRHLLPVLQEQPGHPQLLRYHSGTHRPILRA